MASDTPIDASIATSINNNRPALRGLYAITDAQLLNHARFSDSIEQALKGGAKIIQYRDKSQDTNKRLQQANEIMRLCEQYQALCFINDDLELTAAVAAHGIHLGIEDASIQTARERFGNSILIGASCYDQLSLAQQAQAQGADYVAFGAVYPSPTKPHAARASFGLFLQARQQLDIPVCAIGGISGDNAQAVVDNGADMVAVISGLFADDDLQNIEERAAHIAAMFR